MKRILWAAIICCTAFSASAQRKHEVKVFAEAATFLNLNANDIRGNQNTSFLRQKSTMGGSLGLGIRVKAPLNVSVQLSMGLRANPQHLQFTDKEFSAAEKFVNLDYYLRFLLGYSFPLTQSTRLDIGLGFQNYYSLRSKNAEGQLHARPYTNTTTGETLNYLSNIYGVNWGDSRESEARAAIPFVFNPVLHLGLLNTSLLPHERQIGIAIECSSKLDFDNGKLNNNQGYMHLLDQNRDIIVTETYRDQYTAVSLTLSMVLF